MKKLFYCLMMCLFFAPIIQAQNDCPAIPGTSFSNAPITHCTLDGFMGTLFPPGLGGLETPPDFAATCGVIDNSHWLAFTPLFSQATFHIQVSNCSSNEGMQAAIYGIDPNVCDLFALYPIAPCFGGGIGVTDIFIPVAGLQEGDMYYIMLDGYNGDICDYTINIMDAIPIPKEQGMLNGPTAVTPGSTHSYSIDLPSRPPLNNPCGNSIQDNCVCPPCYDGYYVPTVIEWTGPPGATVTLTGLYTVDITFGDESGQVCVHLEGEFCGEDDFCIDVVVAPICNFPAPPGDSCSTAPLFCIDFLDGYCSSTAGLSPTLPGGLNDSLSCNIDNNAWIRISPHEDSIGLILEVGDCLNNQGLEFALLQTSDCDSFTLIQDCISLDSNNVDTLNIGGLVAGGVYHLMIDGVNGDECDFSIHLLGGVPPPDTTIVPDTVDYVLREISPARIDGPDFVCFGEPAIFTYVPPVCVLEIGSCGSNFAGDDSSNFGSNTSSYPLPDEACQTPWLVRVDTFLVWHLPNGSTVIGDSSSYSIEVQFEPFATCIDSTYSDSLFYVEPDSCIGSGIPMIPMDSSGVISDTVLQELWVEIGYTFLLPDSTLVDWIPSNYGYMIPDSFYWFNPADVYCSCPGSFAFCGSCNYTARRESRVIIDYNFWTSVICEPDCYNFCGISLCSPGQYWCQKECGYDIVNLSIDQPQIFDLGFFDICPGDCVFIPELNESYCSPGFYDEPLVDPRSGCLDRYRFEILELPFDPIDINNVMEVCDPGNTTYTVSFDINGQPPFDVNGTLTNGPSYTSAPIPSGNSYTFTVFSLGSSCPLFFSISGQVDCVPCVPQTSDLGIIDLCPGECYVLADNGESYCAPGDYVIPIPNANTNCTDTVLFVLNELPLETVSIIGVQEDCSVDNTTYTVTLDLDGNPPFLVNGEVVNSNTYVSAPIPSGDAYTFTVGSSATCVNGDVASGSFTCVCVPQTSDLGIIDLCPGDCFTLPDNGVDYCDPGPYAIPIFNPTTNCTDTVFFELNGLTPEVVGISNPSEFCVPDNSAYIVTFEISGNPPFLVNGSMITVNAFTSAPIPSGDNYSFLVESTVACSISDQVDGSFSCPPCTPQFIELDTINLCPGECFPYFGVDYCDEGDYLIDITNSDGCTDTHHFYLDIGETTTPSISGFIETCDVTFTSYTISFDIIGEGPFWVNGNPLTFNDNYFLSAPIQSGSPYSFEVQHSGECPETIIVSGTYSCQAACGIAAGNLNESSTYLCEDQSIKVNHYDNEVLGSDDLLEFILYQGANPITGQIYDRNIDGVFPFNAGTMTFGTSYNVVAVVGNKVSGQVDLNDNCLDISNEIAITYYEIPEIQQGQVDDSLFLTCLDPEVILLRDVEGGSGQFNYTWEGQGLTSDSTSLAIQVPGVFYFTATDMLTGCSAQDSALVLENKIFPVIDVAPLAQLDCANDKIIIDASSSEQGPPFEFAWSTLDGHFTEVPGSLRPEVDSAGTYVLQITNTLSGCVSEEVLEVIDLGDEMQFVELYIEDARCHGSEDALIAIDHIQGGNPGYEITFNDFSFDDQVVFENLAAGEYTIHIEDSKGCTLDTAIRVRQPEVMDVGLQENYLVYLGDPIDLDIKPNFEVGSVSWITDSGVFLSDSMRLINVFNRSDVVKLEVTDINGCLFEQEFFVRVGAPEALTFVPSAFSPNSDGVNDLLRIFPHASVQTIKSFNVFSRWGDLVFSCANVSPDPSGNSICAWDGTLKGQGMDPGVFVYILELELIDGDRRILTGDVMLIR